MPSVTDFFRPVGELSPEWFINADSENIAASLLVTAATLTTDVAAQTEYVYAELYAALVRDLMIDPKLQREGDSWEEFGSEQLGFFKAERDRHRALFESATATTTARTSRTRTLVPIF